MRAESRSFEEPLLQRTPAITKEGDSQINAASEPNVLDESGTMDQPRRNRNRPWTTEIPWFSIDARGTEVLARDLVLTRRGSDADQTRSPPAAAQRFGFKKEYDACCGETRNGVIEGLGPFVPRAEGRRDRRLTPANKRRRATYGRCYSDRAGNGDPRMVRLRSGK